MANMYLYGDGTTKAIDTCRMAPLSEEQKGSRIEVTITDSHEAYAER